MPYLILPKDAPTPASYAKPFDLKSCDIWEFSLDSYRNGYTGRCPNCQASTPPDSGLFGFGNAYWCATCAIRRFKTRTQTPTYVSRTDALPHLTPSTQVIVYVPSDAEQAAWYTREHTRFTRGAYQGVPWGGADNPRVRLHYAHLSIDRPGLIAYTKDDEHGYLDKQTVVKPGKYLTQFYSAVFTAEQIAAYVAEVQAQATRTFSLATSTAAIVTIYNTPAGPDSCMRRKHEPEYDWQKLLDAGHLPAHPCAVYGESDLAIAYLGPLTSVSQRSVVWPDQKYYQRIYGSGALESLLLRAGYKQNDMTGARIRRIPYKDGCVVPHMSTAGRNSASGPMGEPWLYVGRDDHDPVYSLEETCGYSQVDSPDPCEEQTNCSECGNPFDDDDLTDGYCERCRGNMSCCENCNFHSCDNGQFHYLEGSGETLCESCYEDGVSSCAHEACSNSFHAGDFTRAEHRTREHNGTTELCAECANGDCDCCPPEDDEDEDMEVTEVESEPHTIGTVAPTSENDPMNRFGHTPLYTLEILHPSGWAVCYFEDSVTKAIGTLGQVKRRYDLLVAHHGLQYAYRIISLLSDAHSVFESAPVTIVEPDEVNAHV